jgi:hypothetical protein
MVMMIILMIMMMKIIIMKIIMLKCVRLFREVSFSTVFLENDFLLY